MFRFPDTLTSRGSVGILLACGSLWSIAGLLIGLLPWNPFVIAGGRAALAALVIFLTLRRNKVPFLIDRQTMLAGLLLTCTFICFVVANKLTTAANAIMLQNTSPVFILIFSALIFRQKIRRADVLVVAVCMGGALLFFLDDMSPGRLAGNLLGLLAGITFAAFYLYSNRAADRANGLSAILWGQIFTALISIPFWFLFPPELTTPTLITLLILGVFQMGLPEMLYGIGIRFCAPLTASLLLLIEPLLNPVWVFLVQGIAPGPIALVGAALIIVAVALYCINNARHSHQERPEGLS